MKSFNKNIIGSCDYIIYPYEVQLSKKQELCNKLLSRYAKVEKIVPMKNPFSYRNKVVATFGYKKGQIIAGTYERGTHNIIDNENKKLNKDILIEDKIAVDIIRTLKDLFKSFKIKIYNEDSGYGFLRHVLIRVAKNTNQIMLVLVTTDPIFIGKNNFVKAIRKLYPNIVSIIQNVNDKDTSMILGEKEYILYGKPYIEDILCDLKFRISSKSFYQVNPVQTEKLYKIALESLDLNKKMILLDAYCGVGTIGLIASLKVKEVIGVELNKEATKDAIINAKLNNIKNIKFYNEDASRFLENLALSEQKIDVLIMDPPRFGSTEIFIKSVLKIKPKNIIYISCNPETLARDLKFFVTNNKYKVDKIMPVDCFAQTGHVETICLMSRVKD